MTREPVNLHRPNTGGLILRRSFAGGLVRMVNGRVIPCECAECRANERQSLLAHIEKELPTYLQR